MQELSMQALMRVCLLERKQQPVYVLWYKDTKAEYCSERATRANALWVP
jgi:hypothetical protein